MHQRSLLTDFEIGPARVDELATLQEIERRAGELFHTHPVTAALNPSVTPIERLERARVEGLLWVARETRNRAFRSPARPRRPSVRRGCLAGVARVVPDAHPERANRVRGGRTNVVLRASVRWRPRVGPAVPAARGRSSGRCPKGRRCASARWQLPLHGAGAGGRMGRSLDRTEVRVAGSRRVPRSSGGRRTDTRRRARR